MQFFADRPRPYWLVYATDLPWDAFPTYDQGGPATVAADGWCCSTSFPADHASGTGHRVNGFKVLSENPYRSERHWLDGAVFPTREQANRAQYEAGLTARFVYADSEWAVGLSTDTPPTTGSSSETYTDLSLLVKYLSELETRLREADSGDAYRVRAYLVSLAKHDLSAVWVEDVLRFANALGDTELAALVYNAAADENLV